MKSRSSGRLVPIATHVKWTGMEVMLCSWGSTVTAPCRMWRPCRSCRRVHRVVDAAHHTGSRVHTMFVSDWTLRR